MTAKRKSSGTASTMPEGLLWGVAASGGMTITGAAIAAKLVEVEMVQWSNVGYVVLIIIVLSAWLGALTAVSKIKRRKGMMCMVSGAIYMMFLLIITTLFFGAQYSGVWETAILVLCGSILGFLTEYRDVKRMKGRRKGIRNC